MCSLKAMLTFAPKITKNEETADRLDYKYPTILYYRSNAVLCPTCPRLALIFLLWMYSWHCCGSEQGFAADGNLRRKFPKSVNGFEETPFTHIKGSVNLMQILAQNLRQNLSQIRPE